MSEEENIISPSDELRIVNAFKYWYETNTEKGVTSIPDYICKGLLDLYHKEKEKNKKVQEFIHNNNLTYSCNYMEDGVAELFKEILELLEERN